jgi:glycosyltransferase involved in cell wall biosynthesis
MKIIYWCPFIDKVATIRSTLNSCFSISKYDLSYEPVLLEACGEWESYRTEIKEKNIDIKKLTNSNILAKKRGRKGYLFSRILYLKIFLRTFLPLFNFLKKQNNSIIVIHLITSLPLIVNYFIKKKYKIILRISGLPKLNFFRRLLWNISIKKIDIVLCPTEATKNNLIREFPKFKKKIKLLYDPVIEVRKIRYLSNEKFNNFDKEYFVSIGRLTKQKNYLLLLNFLKKNFSKINSKYIFLIIGEGEMKKFLENYIVNNKLSKIVKIIDYKKNIFPYIKNAKALISTSLWEDPGFTLIESGFLNTIVISTNCPNGPSEILNNGNNGYIFKNSSISDLEKKFELFTNDNEIEIKAKKVKLKKNIRKFTIFNHYKNFKKILNEL